MTEIHMRYMNNCGTNTQRLIINAHQDVASYKELKQSRKFGFDLVFLLLQSR